MPKLVGKHAARTIVKFIEFSLIPEAVAAIEIERVDASLIEKILRRFPLGPHVSFDAVVSANIVPRAVSTALDLAACDLCAAPAHVPGIEPSAEFIRRRILQQNAVVGRRASFPCAPEHAV